MSQSRRHFIATVGAACSPLLAAAVGMAQQPENRLTEPLYRVARSESGAQAGHPLDEALRIAQSGLDHIRTNIFDYTATIAKRERVGDALGEYEYMFAKIRHRRIRNGRVEIPFSVYLSFLKPTEMKGREVIYVQDRNENRLVAHEGGFKGRFLPTVRLDPTSMLAMRGNRYPITEIGIENLVQQLLVRGQRDRQFPDLQVEFRQQAHIDNRQCTVIIIRHPEQKPGMDFHIAQVFLDDEFNVPLRYVAYDWPAAGKEPQVIEEYNYLNLKLNVGLTDADFDPENPSYGF